MPRYYNVKMQRKMEVGAGCEDLRARCPQFYGVACKLYTATSNDIMANFVNNTFRARYKVIYCWLITHCTSPNGGLSSPLCRIVGQCSLVLKAMSSSALQTKVFSFLRPQWRLAMQELLTHAHSTSVQGVTLLQNLLSQEELQLFEVGRMSIDRFDRWRRSGDSALISHIQKRKSGTLREDVSASLESHSRQRQS